MPVPVPKLTDDLKTYVVERLAGFDSPAAVATALKKEHGIDIAPQSIEYYDPTKRAGRTLAKQWRLLFERTRETIIKGKAKIGAAEKMVRVRWIDAMARRAMDAGNSALAAQLLEQAAREMGESYTNKQKHEHTGKDGAPLTATINITGRPEPAPAPKAVGGVSKPRD